MAILASCFVRVRPLSTVQDRGGPGPGNDDTLHLDGQARQEVGEVDRRHGGQITHPEVSLLVSSFQVACLGGEEDTSTVSHTGW